MSRSDGLRALAEKVQALAGPCRETDAVVALAVGWTRHVYKYREAMDGADRETHIFDREDISWVGPKGHRLTIFPPTFTASLDASMSLVDLSVFEGCLLQGPMMGNGLWSAEVDGIQGDAATPALALTAAALRALVAEYRRGSYERAGGRDAG